VFTNISHAINYVHNSSGVSQKINYMNTVK